MSDSRKNAIILPSACLALFYMITSLIGCQLLLDHDFRAYAKNASGLWHSSAMIALSVGMFCCIRSMRRKGGPVAERFGKRCSLLVSLLMLASAFLGFFFFITQAESGSAVVPGVFFSVAYGLFWPAAMLYFFNAVPAGRQGLCFGCAIAAGRLIWLFFLPTLGDTLPDAMVASHLMHLRRMLGVANLVLGCLLAWVFYTRHDQLFPAQAGPVEQARGGVARPWLLLAGAFAAIIVHNATLGAGTGMSYLSPGIFPRMPNLSHVFLVVCAPLAGALLDGLFRERFWGVCCVGCIIMLTVCITPVTMLVQLQPDPEFVSAVIRPLLAAGRDMSSMMVILGTAWVVGMAWGRNAQPVAATVAYCVQVSALLVSWRVGALLQGSGWHELSVGVFATVFVLTLLFLYRGCRALPWQALEESPAEEATETEPKFFAFCVSFALTERESEILQALLKGVSMEEICRRMAFSERTFRFHVTGLLKKTGMLNRKRLLPFYKSWQPGA